jgi:hypothetical protein
MINPAISIFLYTGVIGPIPLPPFVRTNNPALLITQIIFILGIVGGLWALSPLNRRHSIYHLIRQPGFHVIRLETDLHELSWLNYHRWLLFHRCHH